MNASILANKSIVKDRRYDCLPEFDERSRMFLSRDRLPVDAPIYDKSWPINIWLDQGNEGACVGFGFSHELAAEPVVVAGVTNDFARTLYRRARQLDEWPGEEYEGTSVLAGAKACQEIGDIEEYYWATSSKEVAQAISHLGPVVIGVNWHEGMENTDRDGFIWPVGAVRGGHCTFLREVTKVSIPLPDGSMFYFRGRNSWGPIWGLKGEFLITERALQELVDAGGAFCVPVTRADTGKKPAPVVPKKKKPWWQFWAVAAACLLSACSTYPALYDSPLDTGDPNGKYVATVINVHDGDTITADVDLGMSVHVLEKFRLLGIDTPELHTAEGKAVRDALASRIKGKLVAMKITKKDKYGRWLAEIFVGKENLNQWLVRTGRAKPYAGEGEKPYNAARP